MFRLFGCCFGGCFFDNDYFYFLIDFIGIGDLMFYKIAIFVIVINVIYELIEILFPLSKMNFTIKSFTLIVMLYTLCDYLVVFL